MVALQPNMIHRQQYAHITSLRVNTTFTCHAVADLCEVDSGQNMGHFQIPSSSLNDCVLLFDTLAISFS